MVWGIRTGDLQFRRLVEYSNYCFGVFWMNYLDAIVLLVSILGIAFYGIWHTRDRRDLKSYLKGKDQTPWYAIGLSVMATQASAVTFLSTPGQGYLGGLSFIQIYFGVPLAMVIIAKFFLPNFSKLNVYTAYEFLENRFDAKTRLLGAILFLVQRGLGAGLTIYAPAIVLTSVFGWPLDITIISCGLLVTIYTTLGGSDAVTLTQKYQFGIITAGMIAAMIMIVSKLPPQLNASDTFVLAAGLGKMNAVNFSFDPQERYTIWSGLIGGTFLMLSYFGTDQSQVQRYITGSSIRESRLGLLFNAICKIPMQLFILMIGVLIFVFYQFEKPPLFFDKTSTQHIQMLQSEQNTYAALYESKREKIAQWLDARHSGDNQRAKAALAEAAKTQQEMSALREKASTKRKAQDKEAKANDADYVFITFILQQFPHGVIGLLIAAFFAATLSSKAAELNALGTCSSVDIYRFIWRNASDKVCLKVARIFTVLWGMLAICFALYAHLVENLIQAVNILGSIFYGVILGVFIIAFFIKRVKGTAVFWSAIVSQAFICLLFASNYVSYLWFPLIGCTICIKLSLFIQILIDRSQKERQNKETQVS